MVDPHPPITPYAGTIPRRTQAPADFDDNTDDWNDWKEAGADEQDALADWMEATAGGVETAAGDTDTAKTAAEAARDKAQEWAEEPEDSEVETGQYSALHHAAKAAADAAAANIDAGTASADASAAAASRDKAEDWAEEDEDVEVETGQFSSKHHALKAAASAVDARGLRGVGAPFFGQPVADQVVFRAIAPYAFTITPASCRAFADVAATAETVFTIKVNGSSVGTITFAAAGTTGAFSVSSPNVALHDKIEIVAPATADDTIEDLDFLLAE